MKKTLLVALGVALAAGLACAATEVQVTYLGHSCFTIQSEDGPIIMIDPFASYVPYPALPQPADIVLMTHAHIDHCPTCYGETTRYLGDPIEVKSWDSLGRIQEGDRTVTDDLLVRFIEASHVTASGGGAGYVSLLRFDVGGIRFAHLGDLGRILSTAQLTALGDVDVLFLPVGGAFTIHAAEALTVIAQLPSVKIVLPMHYYVKDITPWSEIAPLADFTLVADILHTVVDQDTSQVVINSDALPESVEVWVLDFLE